MTLARVAGVAVVFIGAILAGVWWSGRLAAPAPERPSPAAPPHAPALAPEAGVVDEAERLYRDGLIAYMNQDLLEAVALLEKAAARQPGDARIHNALARIREETGPSKSSKFPR